MPESKFTPTGKLCTSCHQRKISVFIELDNMCLDCYQRYVVVYNKLKYESSLALAKDAATHVKYMDSRTKEI